MGDRHLLLLAAIGALAISIVFFFTSGAAGVGWLTCSVITAMWWVHERPESEREVWLHNRFVYEMAAAGVSSVSLHNGLTVGDLAENLVAAVNELPELRIENQGDHNDH